MFVLRHAQWTLKKLWSHVKGGSAVEEGAKFLFVCIHIEKLAVKRITRYSVIA